LGTILVERSLITVEQLDELLGEQTATHQRLGSIAVGRGIVSPAELTKALREQVDEQLGAVPGAPGAPDTPAVDALMRTLVQCVRNGVGRSTPSVEDLDELRSELWRTRLEVAVQAERIAALTSGTTETLPSRAAETTPVEASDEPAAAVLLFLPRRE